jgi:hypothetical protein
MVKESLQSTLRTLKDERDRLSGAIEAIEKLLAGASVTPAGKAPAPVRVARAAGRPKRKNAPRGLLKQKMHEVLKAARKPMAPVELRNGVIKAGYPVKNPKTLYTAIFAAAKADPQIKKTSDGFSLK